MNFAEPQRLEIFTSVDDLPPDALALLNDGPFSSPAWWRCVEREALPPGTSPAYIISRIRGRPAAILPLARTRDGCASLTTPYSCAFPILLAPGLAQSQATPALTAIARLLRHHPAVRFEALDPAAPATQALMLAARRAGLLALTFDHFGNWHEPVAGRGWAAYLADRPGALRETIRRRLRRIERQGNVTLTMIDGPNGVDAGIAAYEAVYARSWKEPEPFPRFNAALMRALAPAGSLRLGILSATGTPIAAQFWIVSDGKATVLKLAHDEAFKPLSPGTVLTALMIRRLLEHDRATELDFGRGDDEYKQGWVRQRRQFVGCLLLNPLSPTAWPHLARHAAGRLLAASERKRNEGS
jgi:CelD/BcsL family acetyltransferase involved in cellulose biosynthesis